MLIAVDHGNKQIKTVHTPPFTSGLIQSDTPGFGTDALAYRGKYYTLTDQRIPYRRDKTEDERFFILTLFAIAHEIEAMEQYSQKVMLVSCCPLLSVGGRSTTCLMRYRWSRPQFRQRRGLRYRSGRLPI